MNLIFFLIVGTLISVIFGEFGNFPFGASSISVGITDLLAFFTIVFLAVWKIGIKKEISVPKEFKILIFFWAVSFISLIFSTHLEGGLYLIRFIFYSALFLAGYQVVDEIKDSRDKIISAICISGLILSILGFLQLIIFPDFEFLSEFGYDPHKYRLASTFLDPNLLGSNLNLSLALSYYFYLKSKSKYWLGVCLTLALAVLLTFSRSAYLMLFVEVFIFGLLRARKLLAGIIVIFVLLYILLPNFNQRIRGAINIDKSAEARIISWRNGIELASKNIVFGIGFNNIRYYINEYNLIQTHSADGGNSGSGFDSSFLVIIATTGIIGLFTYGYFWFEIIKTLIKNLKSGGIYLLTLCIIAGLFVNSQFINSLFYPPIMAAMFLLLGTILGDIRKRRNQGV